MWDFNDLCFFLLPSFLPPLTPNNPGTMGGLFLDGEESPALEDISKWTVEDVCSFVSNLSGCTEYTQVNLFLWPQEHHGRNVLPAGPDSLPPICAYFTCTVPPRRCISEPCRA